MLAGSCSGGTIDKYQYEMLMVAKKAFKSEGSGTWYVVMVAKILSSYCGAP